MKQRQWWTVAGVVLVLAALFWYIARQEPPLSWRQSFKPEGRQPYDFYALRQLMQSYGGEREFVLWTDTSRISLPAEDRNAAYFFIGRQFYLQEESWLEELQQFVRQGNTAFFVVSDLQEFLYRRFSEDDCSEPYDSYPFFFQADEVAVNFTEGPLQRDSAYRFVHHVRFRPEPAEWATVNTSHFCGEGRYTALGTVAGQGLNFIRLSYGRGQVYVHTQPLLLTNYFLLQPTGREYAEAMLSYLPAGAIYWEDRSLPSASPPSSGDQPRRLRSDHPLLYVLQHPPLAWAWYLLLATGLLYLLFRARRRQRVVPVVVPNHNHSRRFVESMARLFFLKSNHRSLAEQGVKLFRQHLWEQYRLQWAEDARELARQLHLRTGLPEAELQSILEQIRSVEAGGVVSEAALHRLHEGMEKVYAA